MTPSRLSPWKRESRVAVNGRFNSSALHGMQGAPCVGLGNMPSGAPSRSPFCSYDSEPHRRWSVSRITSISRNTIEGFSIWSCGVLARFGQEG